MKSRSSSCAGTCTHFSNSRPRHVVVNLECVRHLNAQAIGVLLAHHLRLDRAGGALRICQAHARLMAMLHHVRLTILVEFHPTLDEAVLAAWPHPHDRRDPQRLTDATRPAMHAVNGRRRQTRRRRPHRDEAGHRG